MQLMGQTPTPPPSARENKQKQQMPISMGLSCRLCTGASMNVFVQLTAHLFFEPKQVYHWKNTMTACTGRQFIKRTEVQRLMQECMLIAYLCMHTARVG